MDRQQSRINFGQGKNGTGKYQREMEELKKNSCYSQGKHSLSYSVQKFHVLKNCLAKLE